MKAMLTIRSPGDLDRLTNPRERFTSIALDPGLAPKQSPCAGSTASNTPTAPAGAARRIG